MSKISEHQRLNTPELDYAENFNADYQIYFENKLNELGIVRPDRDNPRPDTQTPGHHLYSAQVNYAYATGLVERPNLNWDNTTLDQTTNMHRVDRRPGDPQQPPAPSDAGSNLHSMTVALNHLQQSGYPLSAMSPPVNPATSQAVLAQVQAVTDNVVQQAVNSGIDRQNVSVPDVPGYAQQIEATSQKAVSRQFDKLMEGAVGSIGSVQNDPSQEAREQDASLSQAPPKVDAMKIR